VELLTGAPEVALLDLGHAAGQVSVRLRDEARDGVARGGGTLGRGLLGDRSAVSTGGGGKRRAYDDNPLPAPGHAQAPPSASTRRRMVGKNARILAQPGDLC